MSKGKGELPFDAFAALTCSGHHSARFICLAGSHEQAKRVEWWRRGESTLAQPLKTWSFRRSNGKTHTDSKSSECSEFSASRPFRAASRGELTHGASPTTLPPWLPSSKHPKTATSTAGPRRSA